MASIDRIKVRTLLTRRDGSGCRHCGNEKDIHIDHCVPKSMGGTNNLRNLQLLCRKCNIGKGVRVFNAQFARLCSIEPALAQLEHECYTFIPYPELSPSAFFHSTVKRKLQNLVGWGRKFPALTAWENRHPTVYHKGRPDALLNWVDMEASGWFDDTDPLPESPNEFMFTSSAWDICYWHLREILGGGD